MSSIIVDTPQGIQMFSLLSLRHRLHLELRTGMRASGRVSTLTAAQRMGLTTSRDRYGALCDVNSAIRKAGGPSDQQSLRIQRELVQAGKRAVYR